MILNSLLIGLPPPTLCSSVCSEHCSLSNSEKSKLNDDTPLLKTLQRVRAMVLSEAHGVLQDLLLPLWHHSTLSPEQAWDARCTPASGPLHSLSPPSLMLFLQITEVWLPHVGQSLLKWAFWVRLSRMIFSQTASSTNTPLSLLIGS